MKLIKLLTIFHNIGLFVFVSWLTFSPTPERPTQTQNINPQTTVSVRGGSTESFQKFNKKQFFREMLKAYFPDQNERVNYQKKARIKKHIQYTFYQALEHRMIKDNCQIKFKSKKRKTQSIQIGNLTPLLIGQSEKIYFYEKIF